MKEDIRRLQDIQYNVKVSPPFVLICFIIPKRREGEGGVENGRRKKSKLKGK